MWTHHSLLLILTLMLTVVQTTRLKRQIFNGPPSDFGPEGPYQNFPPPGFGPQGRPPRDFPPQGFGPQDDYQDFGPDGPQFTRPRPHFNRPNVNNPHTFPGLDPLGGVSKALESIARYDDKRCVARMLCELAAGGSPGSGYRGTSGLFDFSGLRGLADLLGAMTDSEGSSPMFMFGRAAFLGATMRDPYRCYSSYPQCPRDPDRLVDYLNNHNGGFFKMFNQRLGQEDYYTTTQRPPYFRRGKKVRKQKYPPEGSSGYDDYQPLSPSKDVPISGNKPPILAEPDYDDVTSRPPREIYSTRPYKKRRPYYVNNDSNKYTNTRPGANPIKFSNNQLEQQNYYTSTPRPVYNYDLYSSTPRPSSNIVFGDKRPDYNGNKYQSNYNNQYQSQSGNVNNPSQSNNYNNYPQQSNNYPQQSNNYPQQSNNYNNYPQQSNNYNNKYPQQSNNNYPQQSDDYYYDDDSKDDTTSRPAVMYVTPIPNFGQPGNAYTKPSRVLWAQSSRPSIYGKSLLSKLNFPSSISRAISEPHGTTTSVLFPADRTGTGELRLDTVQQTEPVSSQQLTSSSRGGKSLQFPEGSSSQQRSDGALKFPSQ